MLIERLYYYRGCYYTSSTVEELPSYSSDGRPFLIFRSRVVFFFFIITWPRIHHPVWQGSENQPNAHGTSSDIRRLGNKSACKPIGTNTERPGHTTQPWTKVRHIANGLKAKVVLIRLAPVVCWSINARAGCPSTLILISIWFELLSISPFGWSTCSIFILVAAVLIAGFLSYVGLNLTCCAADVSDFFGLGHLLA